MNEYKRLHFIVQCECLLLWGSKLFDKVESVNLILTLGAVALAIVELWGQIKNGS